MMTTTQSGPGLPGRGRRAAAGACASQMEPAKQAIASIESAIAAAPDAGQVRARAAGRRADETGRLKTAFDSKDYQTVLAARAGAC